jgi:thiol-disulfide isomerase/thioredoxin
MRLDNKYFIPFMGVIALLTLFAIIYGTITYTQKQADNFRVSIDEVQLDTLAFHTFQDDTSQLLLNELESRPVIIQFWATWSGKSLAVNNFLEEYQQQNPELEVIAAAVRDSDELILEHIGKHANQFRYVNGTEFFQQLLVPGVPSQILVGRDGALYDIHVGDDIDGIRKLLDALMNE